MKLIDVNVLVYAFREDAMRHAEYHAWLEDLVNGDSEFGLFDHVLSGFVRVVTHPRIFDPPSPIEAALQFAETLRGAENAFTFPRADATGVFLQDCAGR